MNEGSTVACPYCGESTWVTVDADGGVSQHFVSDCEVCCRPIEFRVRVGSDGIEAIEALTDSE